MPIFYIHASCAKLRSSAEPTSYPGAEAALRSGITSALQILADEVEEDPPTAAVEICIADHDDKVVLRSVVSLSVSRLFTAAAA